MHSAILLSNLRGYRSRLCKLCMLDAYWLTDVDETNSLCTKIWYRKTWIFWILCCIAIWSVPKKNQSWVPSPNCEWPNQKLSVFCVPAPSEHQCVSSCPGRQLDNRWGGGFPFNLHPLWVYFSCTSIHLLNLCLSYLWRSVLVKPLLVRSVHPVELN